GPNGWIHQINFVVLSPLTIAYAAGRTWACVPRAGVVGSAAPCPPSVGCQGLGKVPGCAV
ncbi:MAG TPA: hypothetical protein VEO00_09920, partial [Actinomycetota bacterium]|nr:hypothetical protein [Actinomycetota bacterium]